MGISLKEVIRHAVRKEEVARRFYENAKAAAEEPAARRLLGSLAREEARHAEVLKGTHVKKFLASDPPPIQDLRITEFLAPRPISRRASFQTVLISAMKREESAFWAYHALAEAADDGRTRKIFKRLAEEERSHRHRLEKLYDDVIFSED